MHTHIHVLTPTHVCTHAHVHIAKSIYYHTSIYNVTPVKVGFLYMLLIKDMEVFSTKMSEEGNIFTISYYHKVFKC